MEKDAWPDEDLRHVFLATARDKSRCHICLKPKDSIEHISQDEYDRLKKLREVANNHGPFALRTGWWVIVNGVQYGPWTNKGAAEAGYQTELRRAAERRRKTDER